MSIPTPDLPNEDRLVDVVVQHAFDKGFIEKNATQDDVHAWRMTIMDRFSSLTTEREFLALRYGLTEDGTEHSVEEIAEALGEDVRDVRVLLQGGMAALLEGKDEPIKHVRREAVSNNH